MGVRQRIAAIALFGVQLLQGVLPAVGATCERALTVATVSVTAATAGTAAAGASAAHHQHAAPDASSGRHRPAPGQQHAPVSCPMAMACTVVGVMSVAVAVSAVDVEIDVHRPVHVADWPISLDFAPEPPPPRG